MFLIFLVGGGATGFCFLNESNAPQLSGKTLLYTPTGAPFLSSIFSFELETKSADSKRPTPDESISRGRHRQPVWTAAPIVTRFVWVYVYRLGTGRQLEGDKSVRKDNRF